MEEGLLGAAEVRDIARRWDIHPTKHWGQNFVVDANTVRRIVRLADVQSDDVVLEVGPGIGSLTLGLLAAGAQVIAVEIDPVLATALPDTVARLRPDDVGRVTVLEADALRVADVPGSPTALIANLPYNVAVPIVLHLLASVPSLERGLVMVQAEVADRLVAAPGSRVYGVPSVKLAWYARGRRAGSVPASVFWPVPRVESGLVSLHRHDPPVTLASQTEVFACIDAAFAQRRKTLRAALAGWAGSASNAEALLVAAGVDPGARGESIDVAAFARIAGARAMV
ncbi:MAG: 16S rRNA (adenine(1518)-N(6)/adenine(1519)-N(6))-dimethyltransferase RsmA [Candidatus Nanopelagicales bacterium]|nr:16S rRNA (adenine(1518)-N(6)/adenine(1519)-N(6))-dimethyltransferase RsmA [Candidatus Nanopelagicales bacterium]MDP4715567.1 16S rRNA (adenine(1518)-N(6)/adenine(1519)-N(6))-dimethyltransferase RsmA [Candidatus Nanopelagicales bacterium]MDP4907199.1 16S rRNA (adenine(1518)-N(6)/adenine(1519)-N(6))-dimethyltransferase RsmA [Candidatus Nanopelagicales bacterium]MDP4974619.1 16S rRNA (adenine(1518)-N(6)/adenine(1519)-N(6))-dimethyltransferase RsmA [Candidatus Nanopelagicales bacterium]MDP509541